MYRLNDLILPPTSEHLVLLQYLLLGTLAVHVVYMALVVGGTGLSLLFSGFAIANGDEFARKASGRVVPLTAISPQTMLAFGILPLPAILFLCAQIVPDFANCPAKFVVVTLFGSIFGFGALHAYLRAVNADVPILKRMPFALAALALFVPSYLVFFGSVSLIADPEYWPFMDRPYEVLLTWHGMAKFLQFLCFAGVAAGLRLAVATPERDDGEEARFVATLRRHGAGHALGAAMGLPVVTAFYMLQAPWSAKSDGFFSVFLLALIFLGWGARKLWPLAVDAEARPRLGGQAAVLLTLAVSALFVQDHRARAVALQEENAALVAPMDQKKDELLARFEAAHEAGQAGGGDAAAGEKVFQQRCAACHAFDKKVVGPALAEAATEYVGNVDGLIGFITNPQKIRPDYPAMPKLGLPPKDVRNVAQYVLSQVGGDDESGDSETSQPSAPAPNGGDAE